MKTSQKWAIGLLATNAIWLIFWAWFKFFAPISDFHRDVTTELLIAALILTNFQALYAFYWGYKQAEPNLEVETKAVNLIGRMIKEMEKRGYTVDDIAKAFGTFLDFIRSLPREKISKEQIDEFIVNLKKYGKTFDEIKPFIDILKKHGTQLTPEQLDKAFGIIIVLLKGLERIDDETLGKQLGRFIARLREDTDGKSINRIRNRAKENL
jgi:hypothetical protein